MGHRGLSDWRPMRVPGETYGFAGRGRRSDFLAAAA